MVENSDDFSQSHIDEIRAKNEICSCPSCGQQVIKMLMHNGLCGDCAAKVDSEFDPSVADAEVDRVQEYTPTDTLGIPNTYQKTDFDALRKNMAKDAKQILLMRELARRKLLPFIMEFKAGYKAGWVHKDICRRLEKFSEAVRNNESPRLMLFMPPRSGKSEIVSRNFPAWHLGRNPEHEIIACSYAASLANSFSRKVRDILRDPAYHNIFEETRLDKESQSVENWLTNKGGGYVSAGVGGGIVGKGAHVLIIDDPTKGRDEAKSESVQESIRDWYTGSAYTRLTAGGGVLIIMQRWAEDDLAGWLLEEDANNGFLENWEVVRYPAIATEDETYRNKGDALHPERYDEKAFKRIRATLGERDWHALFQQNPLPDTGDFFKKNMFKYYKSSEQPPLDELKIYAAWDLAVGIKQTNDYSVGIYIGLDERSRIWVLHIERCKVKTLELCQKILDLHKQYNPLCTGMEHGQISMSIEPFLEVMMREQKIFPYIEKLKPGRSDKEARASSIRGRMQQGMVLFRKGCEVVSEVVAECLKFPNGKNDDSVDALAYIGLLLNMFSNYKGKPEEKKESWKDKFIREQLDKQMNESLSGSTWMSS